MNPTKISYLPTTTITHQTLSITPFEEKLENNDLVVVSFFIVFKFFVLTKEKQYLVVLH